MKNKELVATWLGNINSSSKKVANDNKTLFFEGNFLYSYGHHYLLAVKYDHGKLVRVNEKKRSQTTTTHANLVTRMAESEGWKVERFYERED